MINLTLKQLRYFEALAQHKHFGQAAASCLISQPALSVQIRELEAEVGTVLFERDPKGVRLTAFGEDFGQRARDILRAVDELGDLARSVRDNLVGRLRVGIIPTIAPYLLPTLVKNLGRSHPGLDLHIKETLTTRLIDELRNGQIDTAILALPVSEPTLSEVALFSEDFVLVRHESEAGNPVPKGEALSRMRLLLLQEGHCFREQALSYCAMQSAFPRDGLEGSSLSTLVQMVGSGVGVTLIPEMAVPVETRSAAVAIARFEAPRPSRTIGMVWRKSSPLAQELTEISEVVRSSAEALLRH